MNTRPVPVLALVLAVSATGCGDHKRASPAVAGAAREAAAVVQRLERATEKRDFTTVCDALLSSAERAQAGGADCPRLLAQRAEGVSRPRIRILGIELTRTGALVRVRTSASGQARTDDTIRLVREGGQLRIAALGR